MVSKSFLEARNISKTFGKKKVLHGVSITLRAGETVGILGPNGSGKTTLFYIITGLVKADAGKVFLQGKNITSLPMYKRARMGIGYLPQGVSIFRGMSVRDNIRAILESTYTDRNIVENKLAEFLEDFSLSHIADSDAQVLSGGECRRVEVARALATNPSFLLLDEPFSGIDPVAIGAITDLIRMLKARGIGVLITDHNVRETLSITDYSVIIHEGRLLKKGTPKEISNDADVRRFYLGSSFRL